MNFENLKTEVENGILTITINRESKMNALNLKTVEEIGEAFSQAQSNQDVRGIILTGAGDKAFVAGADISELNTLNSVEGKKFAQKGQEIFASIEQSAKPVIAAVNGYALGGGCELAMACHIRVASDNAIFGLPEVTLGIIPGYGGTQRMTQLVGKGKAIELMTTADMIPAEYAEKLGLVNHAVTLDELIPTCEKILGKIFKKAAPLAVGKVIACVNAYYNVAEDGFKAEANAFGDCCQTEDFVEGTTAFVEKRKAVFKGK
ncbi:MAG: enoyl-CoA hydratase [Arenicella sp.]|jgi:enoyl-CoA hydratase